jgi:hypothetical protein
MRTPIWRPRIGIILAIPLIAIVAIVIAHVAVDGRSENVNVIGNETPGLGTRVKTTIGTEIETGRGIGIDVIESTASIANTELDGKTTDTNWAVEIVMRDRGILSHDQDRLPGLWSSRRVRDPPLNL